VCLPSVGIDPKELGSDVEVFKNFAKGLKFITDFHSKMSVYRHVLGVQPQPPRQFQPCPSFFLSFSMCVCARTDYGPVISKMAVGTDSVTIEHP